MLQMAYFNNINLFDIYFEFHVTVILLKGFIFKLSTAKTFYLLYNK